MAATPRGHIEQLPSGSFRVHVYAGTGPVTGKPRRIRETCPDNATAAATLGRLLAEVDQALPRRRAALNPVLNPVCENFLYRFKAAPRGRSRRRLGAQAVAPATAPRRPAKQPVGWREG